MERSFFVHNREKLAKNLPDQSLIVLFAGKAPQKSADEQYPFTINRNFYYLTGIDEQSVVLVLKKSNDKLEERLFIEKPDPVMEKWVGKTISNEEAKELSGIENVNYHEQFDAYLGSMLLRETMDHLYLDLERREWDKHTTEAQSFAEKIQKNYPFLSIKNIYHEVCELRVIKTPEEIEKIKQAIGVTFEGIKNLMKHAREGLMEYQLEAHFDYVLKSSGITDFAFPTITASGINATILHYENNHAEVKDGDLILLDLGAQYQKYNADISYTFPGNGKYTERQKLFYNIVLHTLREVTALIEPGRKFAELNEHAKKVLAEECKKVGLIEKDDEISNYYYHGVSHFMGLDTHDVGSYKDRVLQPGMVLTVEPGIYIEEENIGIRIEDDILVTESGHENLSKEIFRSVEDIESFMRKQ